MENFIYWFDPLCVSAKNRAEADEKITQIIQQDGLSVDYVEEE